MHKPAALTWQNDSNTYKGQKNSRPMPARYIIPTACSGKQAALQPSPWLPQMVRQSNTTLKKQFKWLAWQQRYNCTICRPMTSDPLYPKMHWVGIHLPAFDQEIAAGGCTNYHLTPQWEQHSSFHSSLDPQMSLTTQPYYWRQHTKHVRTKSERWCHPVNLEPTLDMTKQEQLMKQSMQSTPSWLIYLFDQDLLERYQHFAWKNQRHFDISRL